MITYEPRGRLSQYLVFRGSVLPRTLPRVAVVVALCLSVGACHDWVWPIPSVDPLGHQLLAVALGMLIVFRTNTAYDRYWEGRKCWGNILASARHLVRNAAAYGQGAE